MYTHQVTLKRPNTEHPFFYTDLLASDNYINFKKSYVDAGMLISEKTMVSPDGHTMVRILKFASKDAFDTMMTDWSDRNKFYVKSFLAYIDEHNHSVTFDISES